MKQRRWLARGAFALMLAAAAVLIGFADLASLAMVGLGAIGACLILAGGYWFLARRGVIRWLALAVVILTPIAMLIVFALNHLVWVAVLSAALVVLATGAARLALRAGGDDTAMPTAATAPPEHAVLIMNPRSGGGKVAKFGLKAGEKVYLRFDPEHTLAVQP